MDESTVLQYYVEVEHCYPEHQMCTIRCYTKTAPQSWCSFGANLNIWNAPQVHHSTKVVRFWCKILALSYTKCAPRCYTKTAPRQCGALLVLI